MSTYRIYVDSRDRRTGSAESFEYALPYSLVVQEKSLANIDVVVIPNSIPTVIEGVNDMIYLKEGVATSERYRTPTIVPGYYNVDTLRQAIQDALNGVTKILPAEYTVTFNELLGRFQFYNPSVIDSQCRFYIYIPKKISSFLTFQPFRQYRGTEERGSYSDLRRVIQSSLLLLR